MVPLARALEAAGHHVAFATEARFCARVAGAGFRAFPAGIGPGRVLQLTLARPGVDPADTSRFGAEMFAGVAAPAKLPDLLAVVGEWRPDLLLSDATDFAGPLAGALRAGSGATLAAEAGLVIGAGEPVDLWGFVDLLAELAALPLAGVLLGRAGAAAPKDAREEETPVPA
jgi:hypothetical protein